MLTFSFYSDALASLRIQRSKSPAPSPLSFLPAKVDFFLQRAARLEKHFSWVWFARGVL
jgi:hypothetical protein